MEIGEKKLTVVLGKFRKNHIQYSKLLYAHQHVENIVHNFDSIAVSSK